MAICEDNQEHADILKGMIQKWAGTENVKTDINQYESAEQFMFYWEKGGPYDLIFLDIQMNRMNGMALAQYIRRQSYHLLYVLSSVLIQGCCHKSNRLHYRNSQPEEVKTRSLW